MATGYVIDVSPGLAKQLIDVSLDGRDYTIDLDWNGRSRLWMFSLYKIDGTALVLGKNLAAHADMLALVRYDPEIPQGRLILRDLTGAGEEATFPSLGDRHLLYYVPLSETGG